MAIVDVAL